ncbi:Uncharacterised protein [Klebsiella variicola]|uniref:Helix-turn-helix domain-containing protein n=2 Tax=Klebsiella variicola TaxID=244366 RepID=A0ABD7PEW6_KLEVA|nr:Uncharacterised protein [Klebsiella variicola]
MLNKTTVPGAVSVPGIKRTCSSMAKVQQLSLAELAKRRSVTAATATAVPAAVPVPVPVPTPVPTAPTAAVPTAQALPEQFSSRADAGLRAARLEFVRSRRALAAEARKAPGYVAITGEKVERAVALCIEDAWDADGRRSAASIFDEVFGSTAKTAYRRRAGQKRKLKAAVAAFEEHPAFAEAYKLGGFSMPADTISEGLSLIKEHIKGMKYINELEARLTAVEGRVAELETAAAKMAPAANTRAEAKRLQAAGHSLGQIAKLLGRSKSTVQGWVAA